MVAHPPEPLAAAGTPGHQFGAAMLSGLVSTTATNPVDVIKTYSYGGCLPVATKFSFAGRFFLSGAAAFFRAHNPKP